MNNNSNKTIKKHVLVLYDGAADLTRKKGKTPFQTANIPYTDKITERSVTGLMQTLYNDLPKGSLVAQMGILGYDPYKYYPSGRASSEAKSLGIEMKEGDVAFRANFASVKKNKLISHHANYIRSEESFLLFKKIRQNVLDKFENFELHHNSDFRNTLIIRGANIHPLELFCPEPHENNGNSFNFQKLIQGINESSQKIANKINQFIIASRVALNGEKANIIWPWSPSGVLRLPSSSFLKNKGAFISNMDFLLGLGKAIGLNTFKMGNGSWNTDFKGKGEKALELIKDNEHEFIYIHINAPDEAAHMGDFDKKVLTIENIDKHIVKPIYEYFENNTDRLGTVTITTDHYTNTILEDENMNRIECHSIHPVPFAIWNNKEYDNIKKFSEPDILGGKYSKKPINHLNLLKLIFKH